MLRNRPIAMKINRCYPLLIMNHFLQNSSFPNKMYEKENFAFNAFVTLGFMIYLSKGNKYLELHDAYCESDI